MHKTCRAFAFVGAVLLMSAAAAAADQVYPIKLERPSKVGDIYDSHTTVERTMTQTANPPGAAPQVATQKIKGDLTARVEVLALDVRGEPVSLVLTIKKFVDGDGRELIPAGKEVKIDREEKQTDVALQDGSDIGQDTKTILELLYPLHHAESPGDDATFGSKTPRKVGETWSVDSQAVEKDMALAGLGADPKNISGKATLKGVENAGGSPALRIVAVVNAKDIKPPGLAKEMVVDSCETEMHINGLFPIDVAQREIENEITGTMTVKLSVPIPMEIKMDLTQKETLTPVKK